MGINEIKKEYESGAIDIKEYRFRMFKEYETLLEYKELIKESQVTKISISGEELRKVSVLCHYIAEGGDIF